MFPFLLLYRIKTVPPRLLKECTALSALSLYDNPVTVENLRETEGYSDYDKRRRTKVDKQIDSKVTANFNEGADYIAWDKWD
jgi:hypothetical protein